MEILKWPESRIPVAKVILWMPWGWDRPPRFIVFRTHVGY
jgi:hypothetical protein